MFSNILWFFSYFIHKKCHAYLTNILTYCYHKDLNKSRCRQWSVMRCSFQLFHFVDIIHENVQTWKRTLELVQSNSSGLERQTVNQTHLWNSTSWSAAERFCFVFHTLIGLLWEMSRCFCLAYFCMRYCCSNFNATFSFIALQSWESAFWSVSGIP